MTGVGPSKQNWRKTFLEWLAFGAFLQGFIASVFLAFWVVGQDFFKNKAQDFLGVTALTSSVELLIENSANNTMAIKALMPKKVVEYDTLRTKVIEPCYIGQDCKYKVRAKRTTYGENCSAPKVVERQITDSLGVIHSVAAGQNAAITQLRGEYSFVDAAFHIDEDVQPGIAEFQLFLEYECDEVVGVTGEGEPIFKTVEILQESPKLVFQVSEAS